MVASTRSGARNVLLRTVFDIADQVLNQARKYSFIQDRVAAASMSTYLLQVAPSALPRARVSRGRRCVGVCAVS